MEMREGGREREGVREGGRESCFGVTIGSGIWVGGWGDG